MVLWPMCGLARRWHGALQVPIVWILSLVLVQNISLIKEPCGKLSELCRCCQSLLTVSSITVSVAHSTNTSVNNSRMCSSPIRLGDLWGLYHISYPKSINTARTGLWEGYSSLFLPKPLECVGLARKGKATLECASTNTVTLIIK